MSTKAKRKLYPMHNYIFFNLGRSEEMDPWNRLKILNLPLVSPAFQYKYTWNLGQDRKLPQFSLCAEYISNHSANN